MGMGDELMASGHARRLSEQHGNKRVAIVDAHGWLRKHDLWKDVPYIAKVMRPGELRVRNCGGHRPYIAAKGEERWVWRAYAPQPALIVFTPEEEAFGLRAAGRIVLEPNVKQQKTGHRNKDWGWAKWQALANRYLGRCVQLGPPGCARLTGVEFIETASFRLACAAIKHASAAVLPEGGLHHAAAAVGTRAVVIYGGFISPQQTGYPLHRNLFTGGSPCGMRIPCSHCRQAMEAITVDMVDEQLQEILDEAGGRMVVPGPGAAPTRLDDGSAQPDDPQRQAGVPGQEDQARDRPDAAAQDAHPG
jgi:hypothetical protein